ncbi:MAG: hypothetical protein QXX38_01830 [Candidatus Aenigmatarchaeota archaeon]
MKAQIATEYLIILSFALMVLLPYALYLNNLLQEFDEDNNLSIASDSLRRIGQSADWVYSQGEPAKINILILIPKNVEEISLINKTIKWKVRTRSGSSDIYYNSVANLTGSLPLTPGYYNILIQAIYGGVKINVSTG